MVDAHTLGSRIRSARQLAGFTQEEFAEAVGVSRTAITKWESNKAEPTIDNLILICKIANVSADVLLDLDSQVFIGLSNEAIKALYKLIDEIKKS